MCGKFSKAPVPRHIVELMTQMAVPLPRPPPRTQSPCPECLAMAKHFSSGLRQLAARFHLYIRSDWKKCPHQQCQEFFRPLIT